MGDGAEEVLSPFAHAEASVSVKGERHHRRWLWLGVGVAVVVGAAFGGGLLWRSLNDPFRTLQAFPVAKYLESYRAVAGSRFKADLRVEADLGWKEGVGRLMVFSVPDDSRPFVVMVPASLSGIYFTKGQSVTADLEVKEGGLIYANAFRKN